MTGFTLLLPEIVLLVGAFVALFAELLPGRDRSAAWIGAGASAVAAVLCLFQPVSAAAFGGALVFDERTRFVRVAIALLSLAWLLWVAGRGTGRIRSREAVALALFSAMGSMLVAESAELITLFIAIEFATIPPYVLIGYNGSDPRGLEGALKYFLLSILTTLVTLYGFSYLYGLTGTTVLSRLDLSAAGTVGLIACVLAITGLLAKMSAAPFHYWAPDAYAGSNAWAVAFASTVPKIGGAVALVRIVTALGSDFAQLATILVIVAAASMLLGNLAALTQGDIRRMMAYSGVGHAGYLLLGVATITAAGANAAIFYAVAYSIPSMAIMLMAEENGLRVDDWNTLASRRPVSAWVALVMLLSLIGIPPLVGFFGKLTLFTSALQDGMVVAVVIAVVMSVVSAGYYLRIVRASFFGEGETSALAPERSVAADAGIGLLVLGVVALGLAAGPLLTWAGLLAR